MSNGQASTGRRRPWRTMTPETSPFRPRLPLPDSLRNEPRFGAGSALEIRLTKSPPRALEARLEHALEALDARCVPPVSVLRFGARRRPAHRRQAGSHRQEGRL